MIGTGVVLHVRTSEFNGKFSHKIYIHITSKDTKAEYNLYSDSNVSPVKVGDQVNFVTKTSQKGSEYIQTIEVTGFDSSVKEEVPQRAGSGGGNKPFKSFGKSNYDQAANARGQRVGHALTTATTILLHHSVSNLVKDNAATAKINISELEVLARQILRVGDVLLQDLELQDKVGNQVAGKAPSEAKSTTQEVEGIRDEDIPY